MEVNYTTTCDDLVAFSLHAATRSHDMRWQTIPNRVTLPLVCWVCAAIVARCNALAAILLVACGAVHALVYPRVSRLCRAAAIRSSMRGSDMRGVVGRITLVLTDEAMTERTATLTTVAHWTDMKGAEVVYDTLYIYVTGLLTAIVPKHGFERPEDFESVRAFVLAKLGKGQTLSSERAAAP